MNAECKIIQSTLGQGTNCCTILRTCCTIRSRSCYQEEPTDTSGTQGLCLGRGDRPCSRTWSVRYSVGQMARSSPLFFFVLSVLVLYTYVHQQPSVPLQASRCKLARPCISQVRVTSTTHTLLLPGCRVSLHITTYAHKCSEYSVPITRKTPAEQGTRRCSCRATRMLVPDTSPHFLCASSRVPPDSPALKKRAEKGTIFSAPTSTTSGQNLSPHRSFRVRPSRPRGSTSLMQQHVGVLTVASDFECTDGARLKLDYSLASS